MMMMIIIIIIRIIRIIRIIIIPAGSAGGPDGVRPQHILDLVNCQESGSALLTFLTAFVNSLLDGKCSPIVTPILFGGQLMALEKKTGGIPPIAIGYTWRRIAAKCANNYAIASLSSYLQPIQLESAHQVAMKLRSTRQDAFSNLCRTLIALSNLTSQTHSTACIVTPCWTQCGKSSRYL